ncbi:MAG: serine/threonine-protein phosphatase [Candidatus Aminicenantes bacterium]|nr:MAG: serine/threonine-protein phosphatase [Candidatus Aminicenantes bacterium]
MPFKTSLICKVGEREHNQDFADYVILKKQNAACWVVADGLGGHRGGETAAKTAVEVIIKSFKENPVCSVGAINQHLDAAQAEVVRLQEENPRLARMRTTVVMMVSDFKHVLWAHVGDSRLYRLQNGVIDFQTKDHSLPQAMVSEGEITPDQIRFHKERNSLLRTMGQSEIFRPQVYQERQPLMEGNAFLLCTDGFWEYVEEAEMEMDYAKAKTPGKWLAKMEKRLIRKAGGGSDNYTGLAVYFHSKTPTPDFSHKKKKRGKNKKNKRK